MQTIKTSEAIVLHNVQRWQEEKKKRQKRKEKREFIQHFNSVGDRLERQVRV